MQCNCVRCLMTPYLTEALERQLENEIQNENQIITNRFKPNDNREQLKNFLKQKRK